MDYLRVMGHTFARSGKEARVELKKRQEEKKRIGHGILVECLKRKRRVLGTKTFYPTTNLFYELETRIITRLEEEETDGQPAVEVEAIDSYRPTFPNNNY